MTAREKKLLGILIVLGVAMAGGIGGHLFLYQPLTELWSQNAADREELEKKQDELAREQRQVVAVLKTSPRLGLWEKTSLPPKDPADKPKPGVGPEEVKRRHLAQLQVEYERYLSELLRRSGFEGDSVTVTARPSDRAAGPAAKAKDAVFDRLVFAVTGRAKLDGVVQMLHDFHRTNLLHEVRTLSVAGGPAKGKESAGGLDVNMTVEALVVKGAEPRSSLTASAGAVKPRVLAEPVRGYRDISARDLFSGVQAAREESVLTENRKDVLRFVRLTTICNNGRRWEAYLYDQAKGGEERRVNGVTLDTFSVLDGYENAVLEARVERIDERNLVIQADGNYYRLRVGDFFYPALETPLTREEMKELGLSASAAAPK